ncbi:MAG: 3-oxoacyl-[acyl-carrier-protein] reductase [Chloroflexi bacterium RBG_16_68_14]|nr:MAG: 3-oxoacyl-[acyl-carrier-protein] reductase [Chloroflexi bacterium RBG_16_68_14]
MKRLDGQVAIVTGASRGIGRAVAKELAEWGAAVVVNYYQSQEQAEQLVSDLTGQGARAIAVRAGVAHPDDVQAMVERALEEFGQIDILVNNAGVNRDRTLRRMSVEEWHEVINTDLNSAFYCTSAVLPHMIERNYGRIINMSSIIGQMGNAGQSNYAAAKAGLIAFTKSAAQELARYNITVNAMCPGFVETDMVIALSDEVKEALVSRIPLGRFGRPEEVAAFIRFLVTEGDWITGQQFNPNGGMYM